MQDRLPPQNKLAEQCVLGSMLRDNSCIPEVFDSVSKESFYYEAHQKVFDSLASIHESGSVVDAVILVERVVSLGWLEDIGGYGYIGTLLDAAPTSANALYYAKIVKDLYAARRLILTCGDLLKEAYDRTGLVEDLIERAQREVLSISADNVQSSVMSARQGADLFLQRLDERMKSGIATGVTSGLIDLDNLTAGFHNGEVCVLAARTSVGKSSLAVQIASECASSFGPALYISLEMKTTELVGRLLAASAGVDSHKIRRAMISGIEIQKLIAARDVVGNPNLLIADMSSQKFRQIAATARRLKMSIGVKFMVIDYLQLIEPADRGVDRHVQVAEMSRRIKHLAGELNIPILCLAQLNRAVEQRGANARPRLSDIRESGAVEQDADTVIMLYRKADRDPTSEMEEVTAIVEKQRNGATGDVDLMFRKKAMRFENSYLRYT